MSEQFFKDPNQLIFIQSRAMTNYDLIDEYAQMMQAGVQFDPAQAVRADNGQTFVYDGLHRGEAAKQIGTLLLINVQLGTRQDAEWLALTANQKHGLRRSRADVQRIVRQALLHPYGAKLSDREIARHCGVDHKTVGKIRQELELSGEIPQIEQRTVTRNGQTYQQDTRHIGSTYQRPEPSPTHTLEFSSTVPTIVTPVSEPKPIYRPTASESKVQEFECPRCGREEIVGVNGSRRLCLNCGGEWPSVAALLEEAQAEPDHRLLIRERLRNRFMNILARLDQGQLEEIDSWLDNLEDQLLDVEGRPDDTPLEPEAPNSLFFDQLMLCPPASQEKALMF